jgi:hypothetical protein
VWKIGAAYPEEQHHKGFGLRRQPEKKETQRQEDNQESVMPSSYQ